MNNTPVTPPPVPEPQLGKICVELGVWASHRLTNFVGGFFRTVRRPGVLLAIIVAGSMAFGAWGWQKFPKAPPSIVCPDEVKVAVNEVYPLAPEVTGGPIDWEFHDPDVVRLPVPSNPNAIILCFPKEGTKTVHLRTARDSKIACKQVTFVVGQPTPPVPPVPPTPPVPPQPPAPIPEPGLRVLVVLPDAASGKLTKEQDQTLRSQEWADLLNAKCAKDAQGKQPEWRVWWDNADVANESAIWQSAYHRPRASLPWLLISNGKTGFEGPLPADKNAILDLVKKYAD